MAENYEDSAMSTSGGYPKKECPKSPSPEGFEIPDYPKPAYYEKIPKDKLEALNAARDEKVAAADEEKQKSIAKAAKTKHTAKAAYEAAEMEYKSAQDMLNSSTKKNKKFKLLQAFKQCLINALPKNCGSGDTDIVNDSRVPDDKKAICIAQLRSGLANEEVTYLTELIKISQAWSVAASSWKIAQESYEANLCMADAVEKQSLRVADIEWWSNISKELEKVCK